MPNRQRPTWFVLRREPYYHKLQYSKTPKFDIAAAVFGVVLGAFAVYMTLASLGSGGSDLSDLTVLVWYVFLAFQTFRLWLSLQKTSYDGRLPGAKVWVHLFQEVAAALAAVATKTTQFLFKKF